MILRRWLASIVIGSVVSFAVGCGGVDNSVVAPENPVPPPKMPLTKAPTEGKKLP